MGTVAFDYSALADARKYAKNVATGSLGMEDYSAGIVSRLHNPIQDGWLAAYEPYGHSYTGSARTCIKNKQNDLADKQQIWLNLSNSLDQFLEYLKETDKAAADCFKTTKEAYTSYSGFWGGCQAVHDFFYNVMAVEVANSNGLTRAIADFGKEVWDDYVTTAKMDAEDWFRHGEGRYFLNIAGSIALTTVAIAGTIISAIGIPFSGGTSSAITVACVGTAAAGISALISSWNTLTTILENQKALSYGDDPGMARFYGDITKYSEHAKKTDYGSKWGNTIAEGAGWYLDKTQAGCDLVSLSCGMATTFGTKTIETTDVLGKPIKTITLDFSKANVKTNVLKTFGFTSSKSSIIYKETGEMVTTKISNIDEISSPMLSITESSEKTTVVAKQFEKVKEGQKVVSRTYTIGTATEITEYGSLVASNGYVTQEFSVYASTLEATKNTIDYTNAFSKTKTVAAAKAANDIASKRIASTVKSTSSTVATLTTYLKSDDETQRNMIISETVKKNYFVNQFDKYILKYDAAKGDIYALGDTGKKIVKFVK